MFNENLESEFLENYTSAHTRKSYKSDLQKFSEYLVEIKSKISDISKVKRIDIIHYRNWLSESGGMRGESCAPKTISRKLASLSSYFDFLVERGLSSTNPVNSVKRPRREVIKPTNALSRDQVRELFDYIDTTKESRYLHKALLVTFFMTGLRKSEVLHLKFRNYRTINTFKIIEYKGKGGKIGQKLVHPLCEKAIDQYLLWMEQQDRKHCDQDWLFQPTRNRTNPDHLNKPLNPKTINEIVTFYAKKIGLNFNVTPHSARATFISELLDQGVDIYSVAEEVNHSSVTTTAQYDKRRKKIKNSPVSKLRY